MAVFEAELVDGRDTGWRDFLLENRGALPYHHPAWVETLADAYGYDHHAAVVRTEAGAIAGGIAVIELGRRLGGRRWASLPFTDFCPPLLRGVGEAELAAALERLRRARGVSSWEVRAPLAGPGDPAKLRGVRHVLPLRDPDELFAGFRSQVRRNIRKAERSNLEVRAAQRREELTRAYFDLHVDTRRRLGVPPQPRRFFERLWEHVLEPGLGYLLLAFHGRTAVAGAVFLEWNGRVVYKYGASDQQHWALRPNNLLLWECIRERAAAGAVSFDFGRTDLEDQGLRAFKAGWGAEEEPLRYTQLGRSSSGRLSAGSELLRPVLQSSPVWLGRVVGAALYRRVG